MEGKWRKVGNALPHPKICTLKGSILLFLYSLVIVKIQLGMNCALRALKKNIIKQGKQEIT
jgi:hypothetical protein